MQTGLLLEIGKTGLHFKIIVRSDYLECNAAFLYHKQVKRNADYQSN